MLHLVSCFGHIVNMEIYHAQIVHKTGPVLPDLRWGAAEWLHSNFLTAVQFPHCPHYHVHSVKHQRWRKLWKVERGGGEKVRWIETRREKEKKELTGIRGAERIERLTRNGGGEGRKIRRGGKRCRGSSKPMGRKQRWIHQYPLNTSKRLAGVV